MPEAFNSRMRAGYRAADFPLTQALLAGEPFNHVVDVALLDHPVARAAAELAGAHTVLAVALRKDNVLLGQIVLCATDCLLRVEPRGSTAVRQTAAFGVRREKAALSSGCKPHPATRSSRKRSEQSWR